MSENNDSKFGRRETFKLATAVSALGVGLGVALDAPEAGAETHKITKDSLGQVTFKLYKWNADGTQGPLLHTLELTALSQPDAAGRYTIKLSNYKYGRDTTIAEHTLEIAATTIKRGT